MDTHISLGGDSWIRVYRNYAPCTQKEFDDQWNQHPDDFKEIMMYGKKVQIPRWQQAYGRSYRFSGTISDSIEPTETIIELTKKISQLEPDYDFNMCLCNWYNPDHYIGPHSDDTRQLVPYSPIVSVSWGYTRTFVLTPKKTDTHIAYKLELNSGDIVIMGGTCQQTHKHEVLKLGKKQLATAGRRINFTFRCFDEA
jgi:alkylated DNA repair dioxygenase AlkB